MTDLGPTRQSMRKSVYVIFFLIAMGVLLTRVKRKAFTRAEVLTEAIERDFMNSYTDSLWGYTICYPSFFERATDSLSASNGAVSFRYWNNDLVELSAFVAPNPQQLSVSQGMDSVARASQATVKRHGKDWFVVSGPLAVDGGLVSGYVCYAKYVRHRKVWFVQRLVYPKTYERAVRRLKVRVNHWKVWEEDKASVAY